MDTTVTITHRGDDPVTSRPAEFVERKGVGHPDSLCDGIAEAVSRRLSRHYRDQFGHILHHNTDKVQLVAGRTDAAFGGGEIRDPIQVIVGGRATATVGDETVPVNELAAEAAREYVEQTVPDLPMEAIEFETRLGEATADLESLVVPDGVPKSNDTSVAVGYAPRSETDRIVRGLTAAVHERVDAAGRDVKVMGWRDGDELHLTVAAAVISRYVDDVNDYLDVTGAIERVAVDFARERTDRAVSVVVNAADDPDSGSVYLTETGLSAEMGDDGNVGRGNRVNGVITPHRAMSLEAAAGKNPVSHVGKLYNVVARRAAERIHDELGGAYASVRMLSRIGRPVDDPLAVDVDTTTRRDDAVRDVVSDELEGLGALSDALLAGDVDLF